MRTQQIEFDEGPTPDTLHLFSYPAGSDDANIRRLLVTVVEAEGDTAPDPAEPVTIRVYQDGSYSVEASR